MRIQINNHFILAFFIITAISLYPQGLPFEKIYPTIGYSYGSDVIEKKDGGFLIAGRITPFSTSVLIVNVDLNGNLLSEKSPCPGAVVSIIRHDTSNYLLAGIAPTSYPNILLLDVNSYGDTSWTKIIRMPHDLNVAKIINTSDGGFAITGYVINGGWNAHLIKLDKNCDTIWMKTYYDPGVTEGKDILELPDKGFIIAGPTWYGTDLDYSASYIIRTDSLGNRLWTKSYNINGNANCNAIATSPEGGFVIAFQSYIIGTSNSESYLLNINGNGDSVWVKKFDLNKPYLINSIKRIIDGYIMTGDSAIIKTDFNGNTIWYSNIDGEGLSVKQTSDNGYVVSGNIDGNLGILLVKSDKNGITSVDKTISTPNKYSLYQNYPNPFNPTTSINFSVPKSGLVKIKVYDLLGREVATLVNENKPAGNYHMQFNASKLVSGVYFYRMESGSYTQTKKLLLLK